MGFLDPPAVTKPAVRADGVRIWGHSYAAGVNADGAGLSAKGFSALTAESLGLTARNNAIGGTSLYYTANADSAWPSILQTTTRPQGRFGAPVGLILSMYGINDINKLGNTYAALDPFLQSMRVAVSRWRAGAIFEDSDASVAYGGSGVWTSFSSTNGNSGSSYRYNPTSGGTFTITTPVDFPGGTIALGFTSRSGGNGGIVTSPSIGGTVYTVDTRNNRTDSLLAYVLRIPNVPAGSAAYTFTTSSVIGATWGVMFDYWQWEPAEVDCPLVVLVKQPYPLDYTAYGSVAPGPPTNTGVDNLNLCFDNIAAEFGARVITVDTSVLNASSTYFVAGNVHPNSAGHRKIADLVKAKIKATALVQSATQLVAPRVEYGIAAPTGTTIAYNVGDTVVNIAPTTNGPTGWRCLVAGTPGTWQAEATLGASTVATPTDVQTFASAGTYTVPANAKVVTARLVGGAGGGGGGGRGPTGGIVGGGSGGGGGGYTTMSFPAASLTATVAVTVGAGGTAGAAATTDGTSGGNGGNGGGSTFGTYAWALAGAGGTGGTVGGAGHVGGLGATSAMFPAANGGTAAASGVAGPNGGNAQSAGAGGGAGGGLTAANATSAGGRGGWNLSVSTTTQGAGGAAGGGAAAAATDTATGAGISGSGGGGGGSNTGGAGGNGTAGAIYGGGGGGGGASNNGFNSGAGAAGAAGIVIITATF